MNLNRPVRAGAGKQKKYDEREYVLLSFPEKKKHAMVPFSAVDMDPLDNNDCSIKVAGRRREARMIARGSKDEVNSKSTRFAKDAGSEEVDLDGACASKETDNESDSDCSFTPKKDKSSIFPSVVCKGGETDRMDSNRCLDNMVTRTTESQRDVLGTVDVDRLDNQLNSIYDSKRKHSVSSLSSSDSDDSSEDLIGVKKTKKGAIRSNIDLTKAIKKHKRRSKKAQSNENVISEPSENALEEIRVRMSEYEEQIAGLKNELTIVKKKLTLIRRNNHYGRISTPSAAMAVSVNNPDETIFAQMQAVFGVNVDEIKAPKGRPSMIMREVFKKSGHIDDWRSTLEGNEKLLQGFISSVCSIQLEDLDICWDEIRKSLRGMASDIKTNERKHRNLRMATAKVVPTTSQLLPVDPIATSISI